MARINYYRFPETVSAHERYQKGACSLRGHCSKNINDCRTCQYGPWYGKCEFYYCDDAEDVVTGKVSDIKQLMREYGGEGWTDHIERDGGVFERTPITLKGNNSKFKYNHHL